MAEDMSTQDKITHAGKTNVQVFDLTEGEVFYKRGKTIKENIYNTVQADLQREFSVLMKEVQGEFEGLNSQQAAAFTLAVWTNEDLGPSARLARSCLDRAQEVMAEINELTHVANNLEDEFLYKLDLASLLRYGCRPRDRA